MEMKPNLSTDGVDWTFSVLETGDTVTFRFREIRRERTGLHALVAVIGNETILGYDTFNIGRREDRQRLGNACYKMFPPNGLFHQALSNNQFNHQLDLAALQTPRLWEEERIQIVTYVDVDDPGPVEFILKPYIIRGGGTILYAPPKSGKSYLGQAMAITVSSGSSTLWPSNEWEPVLYVNLERDENSFIRRELGLVKAFGLQGPTNVHYLHARGMSLNALQRKIREWLNEHPASGVILDSISRAQAGGSLNEDETGNRFIDMMNSLQPAWWVAIAHTPRSDSNHIFGSVMFDAGMDIGVKVSHETREQTLGIRLEIVDANDLGRFPAEYVAFEFDSDDSPVSRVRVARESEFPGMLEQSRGSNEDAIVNAIQDSPLSQLTTKEIALATGLSAPSVNRTLQSNRFIKLPKHGKWQPYGVRELKND